MKITIIIESLYSTKLLSHAEYQTFQQLARGGNFNIEPKGREGVEVTAPIALWKELGY